MNLTERCQYFTKVFDLLQATGSTILKREIVERIEPECKEDFEYIVECLVGKHVFGYSYWPCVADSDVRSENNTIKDVLEFLQEPMRMHDLSMANISRFVKQTGPWSWFLEPIVNRTLKLGIGKSILPKAGLAPMLAKKYEGKIKRDSAGYIITEKLDGNRCIASYENGQWIFRSRNGKLMYVNFDMGDLPKEYVYDGEVMSKRQTEMSIALHRQIKDGCNIGKLYSDEFSSTSGLINSHNLDKDLVYNIFDIMIDDTTYTDRRIEINRLSYSYRYGVDVRFLPILSTANYCNIESVSSDLLHKVTSMGGEGLMINLAGGDYNHKRTDQLLKLKKVQTIDMRVTNFEWGNGKYEGMIGALIAQCFTEDGKFIECKIGSGLSDEQRVEWAFNFDQIKNKVIEVAYFSLSQDAAMKGSNLYSLRFPRLKSVRKDKVETSEY